MPSMDSSLAAFDRLNLNESDVISHLCSVAVEKCQSKQERRLAGCGGHHMRKRVLIKNFVSELMKKQADMQDEEEEMEEEREGDEDEDEQIELVNDDDDDDEEELEEEEEEVELSESLMRRETGRRMNGGSVDEEDEEEEDVEDCERDQRFGPEWYHPHHLSSSSSSSSHHHSHHYYSSPTSVSPDSGCRMYGGMAEAASRYSSPSPPLDEDEREKVLWGMPACTSPDSMALHLRDPYETRGVDRVGGGGMEGAAGAGWNGQTSDPYSFGSSFSLSPPSDDENSNLGAPWHESELSMPYRPPSRLGCSPPYSLYDDLYCSSPIPEAVGSTMMHHHHHHQLHHHQEQHYEMPTQLLEPAYGDAACPSSSSCLPSSSSSMVAAAAAVVGVDSSDAAYLAAAAGAEHRELQEMRSYSVLSSSSECTTESILFDLSPLSPSSSSISSPSATKKRRSDEMTSSLSSSSSMFLLDEDHSKRIKL